MEGILPLKDDGVCSHGLSYCTMVAASLEGGASIGELLQPTKHKSGRTFANRAVEQMSSLTSCLGCRTCEDR